MGTEQILNKKRIATLTLGCKVNQYETDSMRELLEIEGCKFVDFTQEADIYLVNTCSVTNMAERKSRQMLHRAKKQNPNAIVVAAGCYVQAAGQELLDDLSVDLVIGNNCKKNIVGILEAFLENRNRKSEMITIGDAKEYERLRITHMQEHTRSYIKIQDGCNQFCSYCIIPYVRGRIRSREPEEILEEVRQLAANGCKEVILTGIHLSSYGKDWNEDSFALINVINQICQVEGIVRIRLGSLEPRIITTEFVDALKSNSKVCPHFHLSLQSGCNETLARMNRKYTIEEYMESCKLLRQAYDRPAITTDVIVGFPGETEEEFEITCANLEQLQLYEMHIFKYSVRRGTVAEKLPNQVPEQEKARRSEILLAMTARQKQAYEDSFHGEPVQVLIEERVEKEGKDWYVGHTERYMKVEVQSENDIRNQMVEKVL